MAVTTFLSSNLDALHERISKLLLQADSPEAERAFQAVLAEFPKPITRMPWPACRVSIENRERRELFSCFAAKHATFIGMQVGEDNHLCVQIEHGSSVTRINTGLVHGDGSETEYALLITEIPPS